MKNAIQIGQYYHYVVKLIFLPGTYAVLVAEERLHKLVGIYLPVNHYVPFRVNYKIRSCSI
jgi:hypothetical protein